MDRDDALPTWWFEVDEDDDVDTNTSLLQELEIDLPLIYRCAMWMLLGPLGCHYGRNAEVHPLSTMLSGGVTSPSSSSSSSSSSSLHGGGYSARSMSTSTHLASSSQLEKPSDGFSQRGSFISSILAPSSSSSSVAQPPTSSASSLLLSNQRTPHATHIDFWGPCLVVSVYGALLWLDRVRDVPWLYVIWTAASLFNHFVCRVFYKPSKLLAHYSLLGYSITPIIPIAAAIILFHPPAIVSIILEFIACCWAATAAMLSYFVVFKAAVVADERRRLSLVLPVIVLMELYIISLLPVRRY